MYHLLTQGVGGQEQQVTDLIVRVAAPEKLFFLGSAMMQRRTESLFMPAAPSVRCAAHYYWLALIEHSDGQTCSGVQDKIENNCRHGVPVTAIVLEVELFNDWLSQGHPFACRVAERAPMLYDAGRFQLEEPGALDKEGWACARKGIYTSGQCRVQEFLSGADLFVLRKQYRLAGFMLHQAAEQALLTLIRISTGLRVNTHNLDKLLRYGSMVSYQLPEVFRRDKGKDEQYFALLQRAYVDARYKEDFSIDFHQVKWLTERVQKLQELLEEQWQTVESSGIWLNSC